MADGDGESEAGDPSLPAGSKNRRGCTSVAVVGGGADGAEESLILIDCGPTFYPAALTHFAAQNLRKIDAVLLTHGHADAILGLDNLRSWTLGGVIQDHVDVYCSRQCFGTVAAMFPYLVDATRATGGGGAWAISGFHIIDAQKPFEVRLLSGDSITVTPLPAHHGSMDGAPFECLGFRIDSLSYLSDCHAVPSATTQLMAGSQVIAVDALNRE
ncbi:hypothetical protein L7F22_043106 [Adiantum nelumboides]|nr:hypothetical protein [Adiantum nelumboides]